MCFFYNFLDERFFLNFPTTFFISLMPKPIAGFFIIIFFLILVLYIGFFGLFFPKIFFNFNKSLLINDLLTVTHYMIALLILHIFSSSFISTDEQHLPFLLLKTT